MIGLRRPHAAIHPLAGVGVRVRSMPSVVTFRFAGGPAIVIDWFDRLFDESATLSPRDIAFHYRCRQAFRAMPADDDAVVISTLTRLHVVHDDDLIRDDDMSIAFVNHHLPRCRDEYRPVDFARS